MAYCARGVLRHCILIVALTVLFGDHGRTDRCLLYHGCPARPGPEHPLDVPRGANPPRHLPPLLPLEAGLLQQLRFAVGYPHDAGGSSGSCRRRGSRAGWTTWTAPGAGAAGAAAAASPPQVLGAADAVVAVEHAGRFFS